MNTNSIQDLSGEFDPFGESFFYDEYNTFVGEYNTGFHVRYFDYSGDLDFTEKNMYELFAPDEEVGGEPKSISWDSCQRDLLKLFRRTGRGVGEYDKNLEVYLGSQELGRKRLETFNYILGEYIKLPPIKVYEYVPDDSASLFVSYFLWRFSYIFLDKGKGLVVAGEIWD